MVKHQANINMNLNIGRSRGARSGLEFLSLLSKSETQLTPMIPRRDIHEYNLPFKYMRKFLWLFYKSAPGGFLFKFS
jgi:hypothetical protein